MLMLTHGGDTVGFVERYGVAPLDFSVNINPFGLSPKVREALSKVAERACSYPDPLYRRLRGAIAIYENVPTEQVACGNGAAELIWRLAFALQPKRALVLAPTFSEYETALSAVGCQVAHYYLAEASGFCLDSGILNAVTQETDVLFLCNPNNPTGLATDVELLRQLLLRCHSCGTVLVVDECFLDFLSDFEQKTMKPYLSDHPNLIILKAFTKLYGMPGLRLGYCLCSDAALLEQLNAAGQCWPVSTAAEDAGLAALTDRDFVKKTRTYLPAERERMVQELTALGLCVWPGEANYLLFRTEIPNFQEKLALRGILVRSCGNYIGLDKRYFRTAILLPEMNNQLLAAIRQLQEEIT